MEIWPRYAPRYFHKHIRLLNNCDLTHAKSLKFKTDLKSWTGLQYLVLGKELFKHFENRYLS